MGTILVGMILDIGPLVFIKLKWHKTYLSQVAPILQREVEKFILMA
jgi:hypothetical protein